MKHLMRTTGLSLHKSCATRRDTLIVLCLLFLGSFGPMSYGFDQTHSNWTKVLKEHVLPSGMFQYAKLKKAVKADVKHPFSAYLQSLSEVKKSAFDSWSKEEQMAFLINAYNAFTVKLIVDNYPVKGIKKTVGFFSNPWKKKFFSILGGEIKSLDPIEHDWLRAKYKDARIHAAVNCASISCPVLQPKAFTGAGLDKELQSAFEQFLSDPKRNRYDKKAGILYLSKIFDWFEEDFERSYGSVKKTIEKMGPATAKEALNKKGKIEYLSYDWNLNEGK